MEYRDDDETGFEEAMQRRNTFRWLLLGALAFWLCAVITVGVYIMPGAICEGVCR